MNIPGLRLRDNNQTFQTSNLGVIKQLHSAFEAMEKVNCSDGKNVWAMIVTEMEIRPQGEPSTFELRSTGTPKPLASIQSRKNDGLIKIKKPLRWVWD